MSERREKPPEDASELDTVLSGTGDGPGAGVAAAESSVAPEAPALVAGRYQVLALAGRGAMGSVYRARDTELDEVVALKFLRAELVDAPGMLERFRREVRLARRVAHRNVARVFDIGEHGGDKFLTMAFIEGEPLGAVLARTGALSPARALAYARPICEGLEAAHASGVVHRDLKPDNVMVARDGTLVITDFGIARAAAEGGAAAVATMGGVVGTPAYMAPEQVAAAEVDSRADLYALGVMLFEMLTGSLPWRGTSPIMVAAARLGTDPPDVRSVSPEIDAGVAEVVKRCMAREPGGRYASAAEVASALEVAVGVMGTSLSASLPASTPTPSPAPGRTTQASLATALGEKTIAVLPFRNTGAADDAYLAEGLTEDLIDTLSMTRGLRVRPRSATRSFTGEVDHREVGAQLDVQVIVDGSVRRRGDGLRVTARVLSVAEGFQLWAQRFDRPAADALVVSDEVAAAVAEALIVRPAVQHRDAVTDPEAVDLYLRGRAALRGLDPDSTDRALVLLEQAHARAPDDVTILAACARASARVLFHRSDAALAARALDLARRASAVAPDSGEVELALAQVHFALGNFVDAATHVVRARRQAPLLPEAHAQLGRLLIEVGPLDRAMVTLERAIALDPELQAARVDRARGAAFRGDFEPARRLAAEHGTPAISTQASLVARFALWDGDLASWEPYIPPITGADLLSRGALITAVLGVLRERTIPPQFDERLQAILATTASPRFRTLLHQVAAELNAYCGNTVRALEAVAAAIQAGLIDLMWLDHCPALSALRSTARFAELRAALDERTAPIRAALER
ncbi:MAG TPA: protein kinase [Kofleriaceae bacterium]|nr:protein kinase [Kofleriaceae bacterium]